MNKLNPKSGGGFSLHDHNISICPPFGDFYEASENVQSFSLAQTMSCLLAWFRCWILRRLGNFWLEEHIILGCLNVKDFHVFPPLFSFSQPRKRNVEILLKNVLFILFLQRGERREKDRKRNINVWLPLVCPQMGTWPATQACALTGNLTSDPLVFRPAFNPLTHTSQVWNMEILMFPLTWGNLKLIVICLSLTPKEK